MDETEREKFYDAEVAPALLALAKKCEDAGLSILAVVEWEPGKIGRTLSLRAGSGLGIRLADAAARASNNVDALIMAIMKHAAEHGHGSACLSVLGVPTSPPAAPASSRADTASP